MKNKMVEIGYPEAIADFEYDPTFPIRLVCRYFLIDGLETTFNQLVLCMNSVSFQKLCGILGLLLLIIFLIGQDVFTSMLWWYNIVYEDWNWFLVPLQTHGVCLWGVKKSPFLFVLPDVRLFLFSIFLWREGVGGGTKIHSCKCLLLSQSLIYIL